MYRGGRNTANTSEQQPEKACFEGLIPAKNLLCKVKIYSFKEKRSLLIPTGKNGFALQSLFLHGHRVDVGVSCIDKGRAAPFLLLLPYHYRGWGFLPRTNRAPTKLQKTLIADTARGMPSSLRPVKNTIRQEKRSRSRHKIIVSRPIPGRKNVCSVPFGKAARKKPGVAVRARCGKLSLSTTFQYNAPCRVKQKKTL